LSRDGPRRPCSSSRCEAVATGRDDFQSTVGFASLVGGLRARTYSGTALLLESEPILPARAGRCRLRPFVRRLARQYSRSHPRLLGPGGYYLSLYRRVGLLWLLRRAARRLLHQPGTSMRCDAGTPYVGGESLHLFDFARGSARRRVALGVGTPFR